MSFEFTQPGCSQDTEISARNGKPAASASTSISRSVVSQLISKGYTAPQIEQVIKYLRASFTHQPSDKTLVRNFASYLEQSSTDPVATGVVPDARALRVSAELQTKGEFIPPEYIKQTIDEYIKVSKPIQASRKPLWYVLPHPSEFAMLWYTDLCTYGTPQYRRFHAEHPAWKNWIRQQSTKLGYNP